MSLVNEILYGTPESVARELQAGADVNEFDRYGFTPLIESAIVNKVELAELLIQYGADVNKADLVGRTALHWVADNENVAFCKLLFENHANPNAYSRPGQPALLYPLLRNPDTYFSSAPPLPALHGKPQDLKELFYKFGADVRFVQDYINTKLIGHRYELVGRVDIVNAAGHFIELNFEGFFLEFTLNIIENSLRHYKNNFAAREVREYFGYVERIIAAFHGASELIRYQHYLVDIKEHEVRIAALLNQPLLLIPVAYEGHAITFVKYGEWLIKSDRGAASVREGSVVVYKIGNLARCDAEFIKRLIYKKSNTNFILEEVPRLLKLTKIAELPVPPQLIGNCSWANVEASVPAMLFLLLWQTVKFNPEQPILETAMTAAMDFFWRWREWDKNIALNECIASIGYADSNAARNASKAAILGAILVQRCRYNSKSDLGRAEKILKILNQPQYHYVLQSYLKVYSKEQKTPVGYNLQRLLEYFDVHVG
jgi:hypothetical protein